MQGKGKILLDVSETSSRINIRQLWIYRIENGKRSVGKKWKKRVYSYLTEHNLIDKRQ